jgi:two-component system alkaline phosphatase synthesis response regulator PhoP
VEHKLESEAGSLILVVEDDATISDLLAYNLRRAGYAVRQESNGRAGLKAALDPAVDLVLMDLMLPGLDGFTAGRELKRGRPALPLIMLTALGQREEMLKGFESGADDYVTKPFDMDLLLARIQAQLRRSSPPTRADVPAHAAVTKVRLDPDARELRGNSVSVALKPKEYDLLELLLSAPGHLFPRDEIVERVWRHRYLPGSRTLDVHIRRLRERLALVSDEVVIETVRGLGYRLLDREGQTPTASS